MMAMTDEERKAIFGEPTEGTATQYNKVDRVVAVFVCPDTGKRHEIFGPSHSHEVSLTAGAPLLAQLPIDPTVAALCDGGKVETVELAEVPEIARAFVQAVPVMRHG